MKNNKLRVVLIGIILLVLGFLGLSLLFGGNDESKEQVAQQPTTEKAMGPVVMVKQDLDARTTIDAATMLEVKEMPKDVIHPLALTNLEDAKDMITIVPLNAGEQLLQSKIADPNTNYLSYKLKEGYVAYTVPVTEMNAVAGMIRVGDRLNVLGSFAKDVAGEDITKFVMKDIRVLSIGQNMKANGMATNAGAFSSMTLEIKADDAQKLAWSQGQGTLSFVLKSVVDKKGEEAVLKEVNANTFFGGNDTFKRKEYQEEMQKMVEIRKNEEELDESGHGDVQYIRRDLGVEDLFFYDNLNAKGVKKSQ